MAFLHRLTDCLKCLNGTKCTTTKSSKFTVQLPHSERSWNVVFPCLHAFIHPFTDIGHCILFCPFHFCNKKHIFAFVFHHSLCDQHSYEICNAVSNDSIESKSTSFVQLTRRVCTIYLLWFDSVRRKREKYWANERWSASNDCWFNDINRQESIIASCKSHIYGNTSCVRVCTLARFKRLNGMESHQVASCSPRPRIPRPTCNDHGTHRLGATCLCIGIPWPKSVAARALSEYASNEHSLMIGACAWVSERVNEFDLPNELIELAIKIRCVEWSGDWGRYSEKDSGAIIA